MARSLLKIKINPANEVNEFADDIIDTVREPLIVLDKDLRVVKASRSFYDFFQVTPADTIGTLIYDLGDNQWNIPKLRELLETILPEKTSFDNYEVEHVFPTIGRRIMLLNARRIQRGSGKEQIILLAIEDITERKMSEEALSISEIRYRGLFESAKDGILILDSETGRIVDVNPILINMLGYSREHFINKTIWEIGVFKNIVANQEKYLEFQQKGYTRFEHLPLETKDGRRIDIEFVSHVNIAHQQKVTQCNIRDITKHKQSEELLRESEEKYRILAELSPEMIYLVDLNGYITYLNKAGGAQFRVNPAEIIGKHMTDVFPPDIANRNLTAIQKIINTNAPSYNETEIKFPFGNIWVSTRLSPICDNEYRVVSVLGLSIDITERKTLEQSIKKQKDDFETIFNLVPAQIWYKDTHNNFIRVNNQVCSDLGMSIDKIEGHSAEELFPSFAQQYFQDDLEVLNARKPKLGIIEQVNTANGEIRWVNSDKIPVFGSNGEVSGLIAVVQDITERKKSEEALRISETRLRTLVQTIPDLIWLKDVNGVYLSCNKMFERFFGAVESDIIGKTDFDFIDKKLADFFLVNDRKAMEAGKPTSNEEWVTFADDGHRAFLDTIKTPMYDSQGTIIGILGIGRDITERNRSEYKISMLAQSLKSINEIVSITDMEDKILFINESYLKTYGYVENELIGKHAGLVMSPANPMNLAEEIFSATRSGGWKGEVWDIRKDGSEFPIYLSTSIIFDKDSKPLGLIGVAIDITERKHAEHDLLEAKDKAESANKLKDAFIANISHEIRTPLNGILGMSSLIKDIFPGTISMENEELFDGIEYSSQRLIRTVDMILNYSRLQVGEFPLFKKNLELSAVCVKLVTEFTSAARKKLLDLTFQNNYGDAIIFVDQYSIIMAISNLLDNAIKYTKKGFIKVILYSGKDDEIMLDIKDTGIGINVASLHNIFEPYQQEQMGYGRAYEGIGLGLSLVKKVLTLNKANISIQSKLGEGTTFSINFGKAVRSMADIHEIIIKPDISLAMKSPANEVILLVEDDIMNQLTIKRFLGGKYTLIITDSSDGALKILKKNKINLILMDISIMGNKNGLELTKELKASKEFCKIPVIAITAHAFEKDKLNALDAGCDNYLAKPFSKTSLLKMMAEYCSPVS